MTKEKKFKPIDWKKDGDWIAYDGPCFELRCLNGKHVDIKFEGDYTAFVFDIRLDEFKSSVSWLRKCLKSRFPYQPGHVFDWDEHEGLTITKGGTMLRFSTNQDFLQGFIDRACNFLRQVKEHQDAQAA